MIKKSKKIELISFKDRSQSLKFKTALEKVLYTYKKDIENLVNDKNITDTSSLNDFNEFRQIRETFQRRAENLINSSLNDANINLSLNIITVDKFNNIPDTFKDQNFKRFLNETKRHCKNFISSLNSVLDDADKNTIAQCNKSHLQKFTQAVKNSTINYTAQVLMNVSVIVSEVSKTGFEIIKSISAPGGSGELKYYLYALKAIGISTKVISKMLKASKSEAEIYLVDQSKKLDVYITTVDELIKSRAVSSEL